jgi:hypothetical protein
MCVRGMGLGGDVCDNAAMVGRSVGVDLWVWWNG